MALLDGEAAAQQAMKAARMSGLYGQICLALVPVLLGLAAIWVAGSDGATSLALAWHLIVVTTLALGWAVLMRTPTARPVAAVFLAGAWIQGIAALSSALYWRWTESHVEEILNSPMGYVTLASKVIASLLWSAVPLVLMQVFPAGVLDRSWARVVFVVSVTLYAVTATAVGVQAARGINEDSWLWWGISASLAIGFLSGLVVLTRRFAVGSSVVRRQIAMFAVLQLALAVVFFSAAASDAQLSDGVSSIVFGLWTLGVVGATFVGIRRYQLYDTRFVARHLAMFTLVTVLLSGVFVGVYLLLSAILSQTINSGGSPWVAAVAAVVVVLLLDPLRRRLVSGLENRFLGDRRRPLHAFARLHLDRDTSQNETTYDAILQALVSAVKAPGAALTLREGADLRTVASYGAPGQNAISLPVSYRGELLGQAEVGRRTPGEEYAEVDHALLTQLVAQAAAQIYAVRRDQELAQTRREALTAVAEERARLGRNLHDGLAPLLAGAGLTAEALRLDLKNGSPGARDAARLAEHLRHAAGEVRNIAHGLDPGELSRNLDEAVVSYLDSLSGPDRPEFTARIHVDRLPPVVANAAYLVVLEAVNNAIRHANARHVQVDMRQAGDNLVFGVVDDGRGISQPYVSGLGIRSMRKRVEALGGTFAIEAPPVGGTEIKATLRITP